MPYVRAFDRKRGYHEAARICEFYTAGVDKIIFRKVLSNSLRVTALDRVTVLLRQAVVAN